jgi:drug/metabolite transporter (DMT)-like permease
LWSFTAIFFTKASRYLGILKVNAGRLFLANIYFLLTLLFLKYKFSFNFSEFLYLSLSGIIGLALGDLFLFKSFLLIGPQLTMLIFTSSPLITLFLSFIFLNEKIGIITFIGIILVISGISISLISKKNERKIVFLGFIFGFSGGLMQSIGLILAKKGLATGIDTLLASFLRISSAFFFTLILIPFIKFYNNKDSKNKKSYGYLFLFLGSIIGPYLGVWFSQIAIKYSNTGVAATLLSLSPIFLIPLDKIFEKEKIGFLRIFGTTAAIFGIYIILNV